MLRKGAHEAADCTDAIEVEASTLE